MKTPTTLIGISACLQIASAEIVIRNSGYASLPREDVISPVHQGETWSQASSNWMNLIKNQASIGESLGTGQEQALVQSDLQDYTGMITSAPNFQSWKAVAQDSGTTPVQWGNRIHNGIWVFGNDGETFIPSNVQISVKSQVWDSSLQGWSDDGVVNLSTTLGTTNYFRIRLNSGNDGVPGTPDDVADIQDGSLPTVSFLYGGIGMGVGAFGSGNNQQKIQNTLNYMRENHFRTEVTVQVPYTKDGILYSKTSVWHVFGSKKECGLSKVRILDPGTLQIDAQSGIIYRIQKSPDLLEWSEGGWVSGSGTLNISVQEHLSNPRFFYRILCY